MGFDRSFLDAQAACNLLVQHATGNHGQYLAFTWRERLTYRFQGRDYRLTDVHGKVVKGILA